MTEMESVHPEKDELQYTFEFIEGAIAMGELSEALRMAKKALSGASEQHWIDIFEGLIQRIINLQVGPENKGTEKDSTLGNDASGKARSESNGPNPSVLSRSSGEDDLTTLPGVGPAMARKLHEAGYQNFFQLAQVSSEILSQIKGIGDSSASKIISSAQNLCSPPSPPPPSFPMKHASLQTPSEVKPSPAKTSKVSSAPENPISQKVKQKRLLTQYEQVYDNEKDPARIQIESTSTPPLPPLNLEEPEVSMEETTQKSPLRENTPIIASTSASSLSLPLPSPSKDAFNFKQKISVVFQDHNYSFLHKTIMVQGIDGIACKLSFISPSKQLLVIIPYKISASPQKLRVSETELRFQGSDLTSDFDMHLSNAIEILRQKLQTSPSFQNTIAQLYDHTISMHNTAIRIEPLLISTDPPAFTEKAIPFAYQRHANLHILGFSQFSPFLEFLERKLYYIESYALSHRETVSPILSKEVLYCNIRRLSYPFIGYGAFFGLLVAMGGFGILRYFIILGFASLAFYLVGLIVLWKKFHSQESMRLQHHTTFEYPAEFEFEEEDLMYIENELSLDEMTQFSYECFGKNIPNKLIEAVEKAQVEQMSIPRPHPHLHPHNRSQEQPLKEAIKKVTLDTPTIIDQKRELRDLNEDKTDLVKKYSKFLTD